MHIHFIIRPATHPSLAATVPVETSVPVSHPGKQNILEFLLSWRCVV